MERGKADQADTVSQVRQAMPVSSVFLKLLFVTFSWFLQLAHFQKSASLRPVDTYTHHCPPRPKAAVSRTDKTSLKPLSFFNSSPTGIVFLGLAGISLDFLEATG